eukprot:jgi/Mesvir1/14825/Mv05452-RA.4
MSWSLRGSASDMDISTVPNCPPLLTTGFARVAWYKFVTLVRSDYTFEVRNATFDTVLRIAESLDGTCQTLTCANVNDNGGRLAGLSGLRITLQPNVTYYLAVHGWLQAAGDFELTVDLICFGAQEVTLGEPFGGTTVGTKPRFFSCGSQQVPWGRINWYYGRTQATGEHAVQLLNSTNPASIRLIVLQATRSTVCDNMVCFIGNFAIDPDKPRKQNITAGTVIYFGVTTDARQANSTGTDYVFLTQGPAQPLAEKSSGGHRTLLIALLAGLLGAAVLGLAAAFLIHHVLSDQTADALVSAFLRKRNPPQQGMLIAAVITDIEGSTSLWEWNPAVMKKALAIHHNVCRSLLPKYHGYESDTEGDSFTLIFHNAIDALGWAMEVQRDLLFPLNLFHRKGSNPGSMASFSPSPSSHRSSRDPGEDAYSDWPVELLSFGAGTEVVDAANPSRILYRGLRVRMGIHIGEPESIVPHANGRQHYKGEVMEVAQAIQEAAPVGGQVLMSMRAWQSVGVHYPSIICHHMGLHELGEKLPPVHIMQVVPEEMAHRAPFPPLKTKQLTPSFFDAPCAVDCYVHLRAPTKPIVIAFMFVGNAKALRRWPGYKACIEMLVDLVQKLQRRFDAYEVEEKDGNYLLAFRSASAAAQFAEAVQREAMTLPWVEDILEQEGAAEVIKSTQGSSDGVPQPDIVVFRGLRMQIGMCMDVPTDCQPHVATGRAAYFGPIVNRAARIAATAACGQTLANAELVEAARKDSRNLIFQEMGKFDFKGVKEPMQLFQVSSPALSERLFPRTRHLATFLMSDVDLIVANSPRGTPSQNAESDKQLDLEGSVTITIPLPGTMDPPMDPERPPSRPQSISIGGRPNGSKIRRLSSSRKGRCSVSDELPPVAPEEHEPNYSDFLLEELVQMVKQYRGENRALRAMLAHGQRGG